MNATTPLHRNFLDVHDLKAERLQILHLDGLIQLFRQLEVIRREKRV